MHLIIENHDKAVKALKSISKDNKKTFFAIKKLFVKLQDEHITTSFWEIINSKYGSRFSSVNYCLCCKKFDLS